MVQVPTTEARITYYRHGEVVLLLQPEEGMIEELARRIAPGERPVMDDRSRQAIVTWLTQEAKVRLFAEGDEYTAPFERADHALRRVLPMQRQAGLFALYTINLESWIREPVPETDPTRLDPSIQGVADAVKAINSQLPPGGVRPGDSSYRILKASPNWLGLAFQG